MARAATEIDHRLLVSRRHHARTMRSLLAICGSMIALLGVALAIGGTFSALHGSDFFLFAGLGLFVSGALLAKRHAAGALTYLAVFAATLAWSLQDSGLGGSPLAYRIAGPILMLVILALLMPALGRWSRRRTVSVLAALILATMMIGAVSSDGEISSPILAVSQSHDVQKRGVLQ